MRLNVLMRRVQQHFAAPSDPLSGAAVDERLATALLLAELARADDRVEASEEAVIEKLLAERFGLEPAEARDLMVKAAAREERTISLYHYVEALNARLDYPGRCEVVEMLWRVALADGHLDAHEEHRLRKIAGLLYVSDSDFVRTKLKVMEAGTDAGSTSVDPAAKQ